MFRIVKLVGLASLLVILGGCSGTGPLWVQDRLYMLETGTTEEKVETLREVLHAPPHPALRTALQQILQNDPNPVARALAADSLGKLGNPYSAPVLRRSARRDVAEIVRVRALQGAREILGAGALPDLEMAITRDASPLVRVTALELGRDPLFGEGRLALLLEGLDDESGAVQLAAYLALKDITGLDIPPGHVEEWQARLDGLE